LKSHLRRYDHESLVHFATVLGSRCVDCGGCKLGECTFPFFLFFKSWSHTDINNLGCKTHKGPALTNYYRRSAMTLTVAILDKSFLFCENE